MNPTKTFDSPDLQLSQLLQDIEQGELQLPDFQRDWIWDDDHIRSLLASVSLSYPIGAIMLLETGGDGVRFKPRLLEGVSVTREAEPARLILDGQQRLTSLFLALRSGAPVVAAKKRGKRMGRWYYLDIRKALDANVDREEAIVAVPEEKIVRNFRNEIVADYSTVEKECLAGMLPLPIVFDVSELMKWQAGYLADPALMQVRFEQWTKLFGDVIQRFQQYQIPAIVLHKDTPKVAVCKVFEKVNTGGVTLTVFELLTAIYAANGYELRKKWHERRQRFKGHRDFGRLLDRVENTDFLQTVTLLATRDRQLRRIAGGPDEGAAFISCKREDILRLPLEQYRAWEDKAEDGFVRAARLLNRYKIFTGRDLPYRTQLTPMAAILAVLGDRVENPAVRQKLMQWYWCGVFGELYGGAIESRFARDLPEVLAWIDGAGDPSSTASDANFAPNRIRSMRTRLSAAYKGVHALLLGDRAQDFRTTDELDMSAYFDDAIDIHHIFPQKWCADHQIESSRMDSIVNKTPLAARTNRIISGNAPSRYIPLIQKYKGANISDSEMDAILERHAIAPALLRADDFDGFFAAREVALLERIAGAMGKPINTQTVAPVDYDEVLDEDDELDEESA